MVWFVWRFISWKFSKRAMHTNWGFKFSSPSQYARNPLISKDNHTVNLFIFLRSVALLALSSLWMKYMTMLNRDPVPLKFVANLWTLKTIVWSLGNPSLSFTILQKFEYDIFPKYEVHWFNTRQHLWRSQHEDYQPANTQHTVGSCVSHPHLQMKTSLTEKTVQILKHPQQFLPPIYPP